MTKASVDHPIAFETTLFKLGKLTIVRLPDDASAKLPSRGQVMVTGTLNSIPFKSPLEPDGRWSHWLEVSDKLLQAAHAAVGNKVNLEIESTKDWIEPEVPADLMHAVKSDPDVYAIWQDITPMARWEWVRWTRSTSNEETRKRRVEVACSKMLSGKRRPCCWNRNLCTDPTVSKNGVLLDP